MKKTKHIVPIKWEQVMLMKESVYTNKPIDKYKLRHDYQCRSHEVRSIAVSQDNRHLIISNQSNSIIRVVDLELLEFKKVQYLGHHDTVRLTSITTDGRFFFSSSWDSTVRKFNLETGECLHTFSGMGRSPSCFISSDQKLLFTGSYDTDLNICSNNTGRCWDLTKNEVINEYQHTNTRAAPESIDIAYDQKYVYVGSDDGVASRWGLLSDKPLLHYFTLKGVGVRKVAVSENYFLAALTDGTIRIFEKLSGKPVKMIIHNHEAQVMDVRINRDESRIYAGASDGTLLCYDIKEDKKVFHKKIQKSWIWSICLMNGDRTVVSGSSDGTIVFTNHKGRVLAQLYNPVGNRFLITCPPDKMFSNGCFYSTDKKLIKVYSQKVGSRKKELLTPDDQRSIDYIEKLNLKNLIIRKLKNDTSYNQMTKNHRLHMDKLSKLRQHHPPKLLES